MKKLMFVLFALVLMVALVVPVVQPAMASQVTATKEITDADNTYNIGETIHYEMTIGNPATNTKINTLTRIWDTLPNGTVIEFLGPGEKLTQAPGISATYHATYVVALGDIQSLGGGIFGVTNKFEALGSDNATPAPDLVQALVTKNSSVVISTNIEVTKECVDATAPDQPITFSGTVTNTGNETLNNVTVVDDHAGPVLSLPSLAPGASAPYSGSYVPSSSPSTNIVTATGTGDITGTAVSDTADATCNILSTPQIDVTKECVDATAPGQPITFSGTVTNTGNETLNNVSVVDDHAGTVLSLPSLAPGASSPYSGSYVPSSSPSTNIVTATGTGAISGTPVIDTADATCGFPDIPKIEVTKTCVNPSGPDEVINFSGTIKNTGNVQLVDVTLVDDKAGPIALSDTTLEPGESVGYSGSYMPTTNPSTNTVVATGTDAATGAKVSATADATCSFGGVGGIAFQPINPNSGSGFGGLGLLLVSITGVILLAGVWYTIRRKGAMVVSGKEEKNR